MRQPFFDFGFQIDPALRLSEIETILRKNRVVVPVPSRDTLIGYCESGILSGFQSGARGDWYVYESSFVAWVRGLQPAAQAVA
jgi:hypothetical protein